MFPPNLKKSTHTHQLGAFPLSSHTLSLSLTHTHHSPLLPRQLILTYAKLQNIRVVWPRHYQSDEQDRDPVQNSLTASLDTTRARRCHSLGADHFPCAFAWCSPLFSPAACVCVSSRRLSLHRSSGSDQPNRQLRRNILNQPPALPPPPPPLLVVVVVLLAPLSPLIVLLDY